MVHPFDILSQQQQELPPVLKARLQAQICLIFLNEDTELIGIYVHCLTSHMCYILFIILFYFF